MKNFPLKNWLPYSGGQFYREQLGKNDIVNESVIFLQVTPNSLGKLALVALKPHFEPLRQIILFSITLPDGKRSVNNDIDLGVLANVNIIDIKI